MGNLSISAIFLVAPLPRYFVFSALAKVSLQVLKRELETQENTLHIRKILKISEKSNGGILAKAAKANFKAFISKKQIYTILQTF